MAKYLVTYTCTGDMVIDADNIDEARDKFDEIDWSDKMGFVYVGSEKIEDIKETERKY